LPDYNPNKIKAPYAFAIKIENSGRFLPKPQIRTEYKKNSLTPVLTLSSSAGSTIFYTTDGSEPTATSIPYKSPFALDKTTTIKAIALPAGCVRVFSISMDLFPRVARSKSEMLAKRCREAGLMLVADGLGNLFYCHMARP